MSTAAADLDAFAVGQRWIVDTESELGLGTILEVEHRQITVVFLATGETRRYAKESAPLTRVSFASGDLATSHEGWQLNVESVEVRDGRLLYSGTRTDTSGAATLDERDLDNFLKFRTPRDRLFAGLLDGHRWFELRRDVFEHRDRIAHSPVRGLVGARAQILPHQVNVAVEALGRTAPRLLLADEVGLGKTIEAGLILQAKLVRREIERVLVVVPEPLVHQWLVEMLRRFSLRFTLLDEERYEALEESAPEGNPFLAQQLVLASSDTLLAPTGDAEDMDRTIGDAAVEAGFDLLVVDEAHHLEWAPDAPSPAYALVERLAARTPSVLLLTATPEQLGAGGHFARLRLLDPDRYSDLEAFEREERGFSHVARIAGKLADAEGLDGSDVDALETLLGESFDAGARATLGSDAALAASELPERLVGALVDRHGTGRSLFRNTRRAIAGFPERRHFPHPLEDDSTDALVDWLVGFLAERRDEKVLLICARRETVETLAEGLRTVGIDTARFHEGMSIVERDRAAAWFADPDDGCRLLLCSEIGSEGRNFQFLHALVTIELPLVPDLLEQRIGRLDRIGQTETVEIHVPAAPGSADARRARWYHEGLDAFETLSRTGAVVARELEADELARTLGPDDPGDGAMDALVERTRTLAAAADERLESGRDRLLELNSNRPERIQEHMDAFARDARDPTLQDFMLRVLDRFGVDVAEQTGWWLLKPSDNMQLERFPLLPEGGMSVTFRPGRGARPGGSRVPDLGPPDGGRGDGPDPRRGLRPGGRAGDPHERAGRRARGRGRELRARVHGGPDAGHRALRAGERAEIRRGSRRARLDRDLRAARHRRDPDPLRPEPAARDRAPEPRPARRPDQAHRGEGGRGAARARGRGEVPDRRRARARARTARRARAREPGRRRVRDRLSRRPANATARGAPDEPRAAGVGARAVRQLTRPPAGPR